MKISYKWLKDYINIDLSADEVSGLLTDCGLEVEGMELFEQVKGGLDGIFIGEVIDAVKHPNADRLKLTTVDIGSEKLPIVCGAPNVAKGQKVVVATVGSMLYPANGESFEIKKAKIRGEVSQGMICAEDEIGLGDDHDGIMVLDDHAKVGTPASDYFNLETDIVFEIGLTPNRADAMSHFGVARDLLAVLKTKGISAPETELKSPRSDSFERDGEKLAISLDVQDKDACPRYAGVCLSEIKVAESPEWLQNRLRSIGLNPINNVVDITNFIMHDMGQPLHAFDYDQIQNSRVVVRKAQAEKEFISLDEEKREMTSDDLMICHDNDAMCIAGVFGGLTSGVSTKTERVFLESAYFDPVHIRKTAKRQGLSTDASFRYERGIDPHITIKALKAAVNLLKEVCGAKISSDILESYPEKIEDHRVHFNYETASRLMGERLAIEKIREILNYLDIKIAKESGDQFELIVPAYRVDVRREADIVEEILRIYGYNEIPMPDKMHISINPAPRVDREALKNRVADLLVSSRLTECMSNSLSSSREYAEGSELVEILNPLSNELNVMRANMVYDMLHSIRQNQHHQSNDLKLFEFGKTYGKAEASFNEKEELCIALSGQFDDELWNSPRRSSDLYQLKSMVQKVLKSLGLSTQLAQSTSCDSRFFSEGLSFKKRKNEVIHLGLVKAELCKKFDVKGPVFMAILDWDALCKYCLNHDVQVSDIPKFQSVRRDLALLVDEGVSFKQLEELALKTDSSILRDVSLFDVYEGKNLEKGKKSYALSYVFRDDNKTLTDKRVDIVVKKIFDSYVKELGASLRSGQL